jgi:hypothetical protein
MERAVVPSGRHPSPGTVGRGSPREANAAQPDVIRGNTCFNPPTTLKPTRKET